MNEHYYAVIMAGGGGTRLWPLSRQSRPKQMLKLTGDRTLFQIAIDRLEGLFKPEQILVVTVADQALLLQRSVPEIPAENYLLEPMPRGTASVVGLAAAALMERDPQAVMCVLTADHFIQAEEDFRSVLAAARLAAREGYLVTLGIKPTFASTGYGYIERGEYLGEFAGRPAYRVVKFIEKPDQSRAEMFYASEDYAWNSGMFIWKAAQILDEFERQMPELFSGLGLIQSAWGSSQQDKIVNDVWNGLKSETIDYGIMENAKNVAVLPAADLGWNDVGSWEALFDVLPTDPDGNIVILANHIGLDTQKSLVFGDGSSRLLVTIGVKDLVIIDTGDTLLVCGKDQAQQVRQIVNLLKSEGRTEYL